MVKDKKDSGENIKVAVRVRPLFEKERDRGEVEAVECDIAASQVRVKGEAGNPYQWTFDYVFNKTFTQGDIFIQVVQNMIDSVMEGFNATIFAYGQSGSGKTHTMTGVLGDSNLEGLVPRSFHYIFDRIKEAPSNVGWRVFCSFLELYNGKCRDLLVDNQVSLAIREAQDKSFYVQDLSIQEVKFEKELYVHMEEGTGRRIVEGTDLNAASSRSHSVFTVSLEKTETSDDGAVKVVTSKLNLVDLAGSERQSKTNCTGDRLKEGANINLSLSALGTVIDSIVKGKGHIPFRSSPLTMLLKDSLGGGSKTAMFANIRPSNNDVSETISTLRFADRAKQIKNKPKVQMDPKDAKIAELMELVEELKARLRKYEGDTVGDVGGEPAAEEGNGEGEARLEQIELELEQEKDKSQRLQTELEQLRASSDKHQQDSDKEISNLQEQCQTLKQEKELINQRLKDEQGQHHEVRTLILEFLKDLRTKDEKLAAQEVLSPTNMDVCKLSNMLDHVAQRVQEGLGGVNKEAMEQEINNALEQQKTKYDDQERQAKEQHQQEIERISALNEQAQSALNQAMGRLVKMKEKLEKEKSKQTEAQERHQKEMNDIQSSHQSEIAKLRSIVEDLEHQLQRQKAANVDLHRSVGGNCMDSLRKSFQESIKLDGSTRIEKTERKSSSPTVEQCIEATKLEQKLVNANERYNKSKAALADQLKRLEEALSDDLNEDENKSEDITENDKKKPNNEKLQEIEQLRQQMAQLKSAFAKEKQSLVSKITELKQGPAESKIPRNNAQDEEDDGQSGHGPRKQQERNPQSGKASNTAGIRPSELEEDKKEEEPSNNNGQQSARGKEKKKRKESEKKDDSDEVPKAKEAQKKESIECNTEDIGSNNDAESLKEELERIRRDADQVTIEAQRLASELEHNQREHIFVLQQRDEALSRIEQNKKDIERMKLQWDTERSELETELEHLRSELMAEVQKSSQLNQQQVALCHKYEESQEQLRAQQKEKDQQIEQLRKELQKQNEQNKDTQQVIDQLKEKHSRELERLQAKMAERTATLENNRQVLQTQQELLEKKKQKQKELEDIISKLEQQLQSSEESWKLKLSEQAERMTQHNNRKIEELSAQHRHALLSEQKEREKINKKILKEKMKVDKVRERYDQQLVVCRELEQQLEQLKLADMKRFQQGNADEVEQQRAEINQLLHKKELTERQQELLGVKKKPTKWEDDDDLSINPVLAKANRRQQELLAKVDYDSDIPSKPRGRS